MKRTMWVATLIGGLCLTGATQALATDEYGDGSVKGVCKFNADRPKRSSLKMGADPACDALHEDKVYPQGLYVFKDGTLPYVFVYVKKGMEGKEYTTPTEPAVIDQNGCMYKPHVFGMMAGQDLEIRNSDPTSHNIHALPQKNQEFNIGQPKQGMKTMRQFSKPEVMVKFKCDVHPWMSAWCGVMSHPFFDVTAKGGTFALSKLPPGDYVIGAWHEQWGEQEQAVTVSSGETKEIEFVFEPK